MSDLLAGKSALVLGASRGIGEGIARALFAEGAKVMLAARTESALAAIAADLDRSGERAAVVRLDMTDAGSIEAAVNAAVARFGRLDIAVNNAGLQIARAPIPDIPVADFDAVLGVNLRGVFVAMQHQITAMRRNGRGSIVNIASAAGLIGVPMAAPYVASKHGLIGLTKSAALELAEEGLRVNAVLPGPVMTRLLRAGPASNPDALAALMARVPMRRMASPAEVAAAVLWLASDAASYVTGVSLPVDGGMIVP